MMISCPVATSADLIGSAAGPAPYHLDEESHRATGVIEFLPLRDLGTQHILRVLQHTHGKIRPAARILGVTRWSLARRLRKRSMRPFATEVPRPMGSAAHTRHEFQYPTEARRGE